MATSTHCWELASGGPVISTANHSWSGQFVTGAGESFRPAHPGQFVQLGFREFGQGASAGHDGKVVPRNALVTFVVGRNCIHSSLQSMCRHSIGWPMRVLVTGTRLLLRVAFLFALESESGRCNPEAFSLQSYTSDFAQMDPAKALPTGGKRLRCSWAKQAPRTPSGRCQNCPAPMTAGPMQRSATTARQQRMRKTVGAGPTMVERP